MDQFSPETRRKVREIVKKSGNDEFNKKNYMLAVQQYTKIIQSEPHATDILANRSLAYLKHGLYSVALEDSEAVLAQNPTHKKCIVRKVQSLWGLRRYDEALEVLQAKVPATQLETPYYKELHTKALKFLKQSKGEYDLEELNNLSPGEYHEIGEYIGPLEVVPTPGKSRDYCVVATADIAPGELVAVTKALSVCFNQQAEKNGLDMTTQEEAYLLQNICEKLSFEVSIRDDFSSLTNGNKFGPRTNKPGSKWIWENSDDELEEQMMIHAVRDRLTINTFGSDGTPSYSGLWILLSHFSHKCVDSNVYYKFCGDVSVTRATKFIKKGEELTICYLAPQDTTRRVLLTEHYNFQCNCRLCVFEDNEKKQTKAAVEETLKAIKSRLKTIESEKRDVDGIFDYELEFISSRNPTLVLKGWNERLWGLDTAPVLSASVTSEKHLNALLKLVRRLISLRHDNVSLNLALMDRSIEQVCIQLSSNQMIAECVEVMEAVRDVYSNYSPYVEIVVEKDIIILALNLKLGRFNDIMKWHGILKEDLVRAYGSIEIMRTLKWGKLLLKKIDELELGIDFFTL